MAALTWELFSDALEMGTSVRVVLPQDTDAQIGVDARESVGDLPVLYLLHGLSDDHSAWTRYTSLERYAEETGVAVVMPAAGRSFYADERHGQRWWTWVSDELPTLVQRYLRVSTRREDTWVAGLSMGGYGALKLALRHPERYAGAASLSGALDAVALSRAPERAAFFHRVFGGEPGPDDDLFALLETADPASLPLLHVSCGVDDVLLPQSERFVAAARARGLDPVTAYPPGGHEWAVWDAVVADVLRWLPRAWASPDHPGAVGVPDDPTRGRPAARPPGHLE